MFPHQIASAFVALRGIRASSPIPVPRVNRKWMNKIAPPKAANPRTKPESHPPQTGPSDEIDRQLEALIGWFRDKFSKSTLAEIVTMGTSCLLVLLGGVAALIYWGQLNQLTRQLPEIQRQTKTIRQTEINSARAWVGLAGPVVTDHLEANPVFRIGGHYTIKNFGAGPAIKVAAMAWPVIWDLKKVEYMNLGKIVCDDPIGLITNSLPHTPNVHIPGPMGYVLFPGQTHDEQVGGGIWTGQPVPAIKHFWFIGCVAYLDQFNTIHWTRFCFESSYSARLPLTKDTPLVPCALFNDTDSNKSKD